MRDYIDAEIEEVMQRIPEGSHGVLAKVRRQSSL